MRLNLTIEKLGELYDGCRTIDAMKIRLAHEWKYLKELKSLGVEVESVDARNLNFTANVESNTKRSSRLKQLGFVKEDDFERFR